MERGPNEWGDRLFVLRIWSSRGDVRGVIRNAWTGETAAFASREGFLKCMRDLHDASVDPNGSAGR